jgi:hypothetical protein
MGAGNGSPLSRKNEMKLRLLIAMLVGAAGLLFGEGSIVETKTSFGPVVKYRLAWTASTNGIVSNATTFAVRGSLLRVTFTGAGTGATYTATLSDSYSVDVLAGMGKGIASNTTTTVCPGLPVSGGSVTSSIPFAVNDIVTLKILDAGDSKTGSVVLFVE